MKYHLKLKKALSYTGVVTATRKNPDVYTDDEKVADTAVASGYFDLVEHVENDQNSSTVNANTVKGYLDYAQLMTMTLNDLKDLAAKLEVDCTGLKTKDDYSKAISAVEVEAPADGGEADFSEE